MWGEVELDRSDFVDVRGRSYDEVRAVFLQAEARRSKAESFRRFLWLCAIGVIANVVASVWRIVTHRAELGIAHAAAALLILVIAVGLALYSDEVRS